LEKLQILQSDPIAVFRPRVVLYEDTNDSGALEAEPIDATGTDRILAVDDEKGGSVAAVQNLTAVIRHLALEEADEFYRLTGGRFSPVLRVQRRGNRLRGLARAKPMLLSVSDSERPREDLACNRRLTEFPVNGYSSANTQLLFDKRLDRGAVCGGAAVRRCDAADLTRVRPSSIEPHQTDGRQRTLQCRMFGNDEVLVDYDSRYLCGGCTCAWHSAPRVYVAAAGATPKWWPCGRSVSFCDSAQPFYRYDPACEMQPPATAP